MKTEFEPEDIRTLAEKVAEILKPCLTGSRDEDAVYDKESLASYLHVDVTWINRQITERSIPYLKVGKYSRFKKSHIDSWLESMKVEPSPLVKMFQKRGQIG
jgi:excisionase family DNA binding protein